MAFLLNLCRSGRLIVGESPSAHATLTHLDQMLRGSLGDDSAVKMQWHIDFDRMTVVLRQCRMRHIAMQRVGDIASCEVMQSAEHICRARFELIFLPGFTPSRSAGMTTRATAAATFSLSQDPEQTSIVFQTLSEGRGREQNDSARM
jgi:hypothetical protein